MKDTLSLISDLAKSLNPKASIEEAEKWWSAVLFIESNVTLFATPSRDEKRLVEQLKRGVSSLIADIRARQPSPDLTRAQVALTALQSDIEKHTTGPDGWPLKR